MIFKKNQVILVLLVIVVIKHDHVDSILTRGPSDVVAVEGSTVVFSCYTNLSRPVYWDTEKSGDKIDQWYPIYQGNPGVITYQFDKRFNMSVDSTSNQYNLTIHDVQMEDAGTYRCGDNFGIALNDYERGILNQGATAELTVIGSNLTCSTNVSSNYQYTDGSDSLPSEVINCSLSYEGRILPTLRWTTVWNNGDGENNSKFDYMFPQKCPTAESDGSRLTSTMIISAPQVTGQRLVKFSVLTSSGDLTGFKQNYDHLRQDLSSDKSTFGVATPLLGGFLLGALSLALILSAVLALTLHRRESIKIWKYRITIKQETTKTFVGSDRESVPPVEKEVASKILQSENTKKEISAEVDKPFKIEIWYEGSPESLAAWNINEKPIATDERFKTEMGTDVIVLTCTSAQNTDKGILFNKKGADIATVNVKIVKKPASPEGPLEVKDITPNTCTLSWRPPKSDGGKPVSHYVVEKREKKSGNWTMVSNIDVNDCYVYGLEEGMQYDFRVSAANEVGKSEPLVTDKYITAKYQFSNMEKNIEWSPPFVTYPDGVHKSDFDDSELIDCFNPVIYITGIKFFCRSWDLVKCVYGMKVTYSNGKKIQHGGKQPDLNCEIEKCKLEADERIIEVTLHSGWMIDGMSFKTNKRCLGPYGGSSGDMNVVQGPPCARSYLAVLKGQEYAVNGGLAVKHLQFGWVNWACDSSQK